MADSKKKSFVMYNDFWDVLEELDIEQRGVLLTAIYAVVLGKDVPDMDKETRIVFKSIKSQIVRDQTKYEETIAKRSRAGKKGAETRWGSKNGKTVENPTIVKQTIANIADNVNDNVNDNDNVNVNVSAMADDDTTQTYGLLDNVKLTRAEFDTIRSTYESPMKLIDKVSAWLPDADHPPEEHFALVHRFAINDNWPKRPEPEPPAKPPDPERGEFCSAPEVVKKKARAVLEG